MYVANWHIHLTCPTECCVQQQTVVEQRESIQTHAKRAWEEGPIERSNSILQQ